MLLIYGEPGRESGLGQADQEAMMSDYLPSRNASSMAAR